MAKWTMRYCARTGFIAAARLGSKSTAFSVVPKETDAGMLSASRRVKGSRSKYDAPCACNLMSSIERVRRFAAREELLDCFLCPVELVGNDHDRRYSVVPSISLCDWCTAHFGGLFPQQFLFFTRKESLAESDIVEGVRLKEEARPALKRAGKIRPSHMNFAFCIGD